MSLRPKAPPHPHRQWLRRKRLHDLAGVLALAGVVGLVFWLLPLPAHAQYADPPASTFFVPTVD
jgi:ferric-dicitrate binding protein FerR (iron transport regulator)